MAEPQATDPTAPTPEGGAAGGTSPPIAEGGEEANAAQLPAPNSTAQLYIDASQPSSLLHVSLLTHHSRTMPT
jgi:hypothetical protein